MADVFYNLAKKQIMDGTIDLVVDDIQVLLIASTPYTPDADHDFIDESGASDIVDAELSGAGYARKSLATKTIVEDDPNNRAEYNADDLAYTGADFGTIAAVIVFKNTGVDTTSVVIAYLDTLTGLPLVTNGGNVDIAWNAEGILQLT
jgi:hypothetical protein